MDEDSEAEDDDEVVDAAALRFWPTAGCVTDSSASLSELELLDDPNFLETFRLKGFLPTSESDEELELEGEGDFGGTPTD